MINSLLKLSRIVYLTARSVQRIMTAALHRVPTSPIAPHPGFEDEVVFHPSGSLSYRPRGRTTPAGEMYARRNVVGNPIPTDPGSFGGPYR